MTGVEPLPQPTAEFVAALKRAQRPLYAYIRSLHPEAEAAKDILQETNLTLCRRWETFVPGTQFMAWACRVAYFQVLNHRRKLSRDRLVFDSDTVATLADSRPERWSARDGQQEALRSCLERLPAHARSLLEQRYAPGGSVQRIAAASGRSPGAVSQALARLRDELLHCIQRRIRS
jgi:RNA polymerase sigma-70 factor (ECF subfamily)